MAIVRYHFDPTNPPEMSDETEPRLHAIEREREAVDRALAS